MKIEQIYTNCLAEATYYIESNGEVAIVDPLRETRQYVDKANENNATIKYVFETHFHADFVSGHIDLARKTGAKIIFGPNANASYDFYSGKDNELFKLGNIQIKLLHTPGHTMESSCYLVIDEQGKEIAVFTGDTLFIGDVGRPDLAVKSNLTIFDLASYMYDSLRNKIIPLPDDVIIYPAHGAGSSCGKNMSKETFDTLGNQKKNNYALDKNMTKEKFIKEVTKGIDQPPQYFGDNIKLNMRGYNNFDRVLSNANKPLTVEEFKILIRQGACILDVRSQKDFCKGFIPNAIFIGLQGSFAPWVGAIIEGINTPIVLVVDKGKEQETITRLARVGYDNCLGFLKGGFQKWIQAGEPIDTIDNISVDQIEKIYAKDCNIVDVRNCNEYAAKHIKGVKHYNLAEMPSNLNVLDNRKKYYVHCAGGYRSVIAISLLKKNNYTNLVNIEKGFRALQNSNLPME